MTKVLILSVSGIGNTILQSPMINAILKRDFTTDILFKNKALESVFEYDKRINKKYIIPKTNKEKLKLIKELRKNRYDYTIACFPSNKSEFNLLPFLIMAKKRIIHSYNIDKLKTLSFLSNIKIKADKNLHDVDQNLNLLKLLNIDPEKEGKELIFNLGKDDEKYAEEFLKKNRLNKPIGIHPGCDKNQKYRRWPKEYFVELINRLTKNNNILLFAGPDEIEEVTWIYNNSSNKNKIFLIKEKNLNYVGALIKRCKLLISSDSGLGHIAAALKVHAFAIFGPAMASRTRPYGKYGHYISLGLPPTLKYPFYSTSSKVKDEKQESLIKLKPDLVYEKINSFL